jgi:hypothetical protein
VIRRSWRDLLVVVLVGSCVACAQIAGLSAHVSGSDAGAGADGGAEVGVVAPGPDGAGAGPGPDSAAGGSSADGALADAPPVSVALGPRCGGPDAALCPTGLGDCHGTGCNVVLSSDRDNCGACGHSCRGGACQDGACLPTVLARDQKFGERRQVAVGPSGVTWGTSDGFLWRLPFEPGAQPIKLAEGEGEVEDIVLDGQFAYIKASGGQCQHDWCLRRIALVPGQFPSTSLGDVARNSSYMAIDADALYYESANSVFRLPLHGSGLPAPQELAQYQGTISIFGIAIDRDHVYWGTTEDIAYVRRMRVDGSEKTPQDLAKGDKEVWSVAVDETNVYWTTGAEGLVQATAKQGGSPVTTVAHDDAPTTVLAVDDVNVYWGGGGTSDLKKAPKCGGEKQIAARSHPVLGIVPAMGYVYFNDSVSGLFRIAQ